LFATGNQRTRLQAAIALSRIAPERAGEWVPFLTEQMDVQDAEWTYKAGFIAGVLGEIGPPARSAVPRLERLVAAQNEDGFSALSAAAALCRIVPETQERGLRMLTEALADPKGSHRYQAAVKLGELGSSAQQALPVLEAAAKDEDPFLREAASRALAKVNGNAK
jgi:hypothetical protein